MTIRQSLEDLTQIPVVPGLAAPDPEATGALQGEKAALLVLKLLIDRLENHEAFFTSQEIRAAEAWQGEIVWWRDGFKDGYRLYLQDPAT